MPRALPRPPNSTALKTATSRHSQPDLTNSRDLSVGTDLIDHGPNCHSTCSCSPARPSPPSNTVGLATSLSRCCTADSLILAGGWRLPRVSSIRVSSIRASALDCVRSVKVSERKREESRALATRAPSDDAGLSFVVRHLTPTTSLFVV